MIRQAGAESFSRCEASYGRSPSWLPAQLASSHSKTFGGLETSAFALPCAPHTEKRDLTYRMPAVQFNSLSPLDSGRRSLNQEEGGP